MVPHSIPCRWMVCVWKSDIPPGHGHFNGNNDDYSVDLGVSHHFQTSPLKRVKPIIYNIFFGYIHSHSDEFGALYSMDLPWPSYQGLDQKSKACWLRGLGTKTLGSNINQPQCGCPWYNGDIVGIWNNRRCFFVKKIWWLGQRLGSTMATNLVNTENSRIFWKKSMWLGDVGPSLRPNHS